MRGSRRRATLTLAAVAAAAAAGPAARADDVPPPPPAVAMSAAAARVWTEGRFNVVELTGPGASVTVDGPDVGHATLSADAVVVWLSPEPAGPADARRVEVALLGHAMVVQDGRTRTQDQLFVPTTAVRGTVALQAPRTPGPVADDAEYARAVALRRSLLPAATTKQATTTRVTTTRAAVAPATTAGAAATRPASPAVVLTRPEPTSAPPRPGVVPLPPVSPAPPALVGAATAARSISIDRADFTLEHTATGALAVVLSGGVTVRYRDAKKDVTEFAARTAVMFTNLTDADLKILTRSGSSDKDVVAEHVVSAYFEGDVQVYVTPAQSTRSEVRMRASHVYYEFATDRAVLTDVVLHTVDVRKGIPIFVRADAVRQESQTEFDVDGARFSSSAFQTPTYDLRAGHAYVRLEDEGADRSAERVTFAAQDVTLDAVGVPFFYFPAAGGTVAAKGTPFRGIGLENSNQFGFGVRTKWGLFESLGQVPPDAIDASYQLDYYGKRGPGLGLDGQYAAGWVTDQTKQPVAFAGDLHAYLVPDDQGTDVLGAARSNETPADTFRGRVVYEHEFLFPDGWQVQARAGYLSDSNFLPQWEYPEYQNALPVNESLYAVNRDGSGYATAVAEFQPNRVVSSADFEQENREINRLPELGYDRVGDSLADDKLTLFSENSAAGLKYARAEQSLAQQGFSAAYSPGLPAFAYTGDPGRTTFRTDTRQELDVPLGLGPVRVVPYAFGRYTFYNQGLSDPARPNGSRTIPTRVAVSPDQNRLLVGAGARLTTDFWRADDSVESDLFDLHRLRHVITPGVNVFATAQTVDQNRLFVYDQNVDAANDVQGLQIDLLQRWQTKRGGPGRWRSVDWLTLDVYANYFANKPDVRLRDPADFRSVFFATRPETSQPRDTANADATWRVSDTTAVLANFSQNLDYRRVAFAAIGVAVQRDTRLSYYLGTRYIAALKSDYANVQVTYELDAKYSVSASEGIDLAQNRNVYYTATITRKFDNFAASINAYYDEASNNEGFSVNVQPFGFGRALGSNQVTQPAP